MLPNSRRHVQPDRSGPSYSASGSLSRGNTRELHTKTPQTLLQDTLTTSPNSQLNLQADGILPPGLSNFRSFLASQCFWSLFTPYCGYFEQP